MQPLTLRQRKVLQAANYFCRTAGQKDVGISHLTEKLKGDRFLTWEDLDRIQGVIPADSPELWAFWFTALCNHSVVPTPDPSFPQAQGAVLVYPTAPCASFLPLKEAA